MMALIVGGSGSGKSALAEQLACTLSDQRVYAATMSPYGAEAQARIARHREQRNGLGFRTVECPQSLACLMRARARHGVVLVEDLGNLVANALFATDGSMADPNHVQERLAKEVIALSHSFEHVVVVGNQVGSEGRATFDATYIWVRTVGALCCQVAAHAQAVVEVVAGCAHVVKGRLP